MINKRFFQILLFIVAVEIIYALPFVLIRLFRPSIIHAFDITNTQIGYCYTLYGATALVFYFFGGLIADRYQPKLLMSIALVTTGIGGLFLVFFPSLTTLYIMYVYWGITTILLFWSALIKATRIWGGKDQQIKAFGLLEGGRGIVAALIGTIGVVFFSTLLPEAASTSKVELQTVLKDVYLIVSVAVIIVGFLLLFLPNYNTKKDNIITRNSYKQNTMRAIKHPVVWMLMLIILSAYIGFRIADVFTQYTNEIYGYTDKESALFGVIISYLRPLVCLFIILFAKKATPTKWLIFGFLITTLSSFLLSLNVNLSLSYTINLLSLTSTLVGIYALRVVYFTIIEESNIPISITGTVVGIISIVGYSPDLFIGPLVGYYLDVVGGETGYQYLFIFLLLSSFIGLLASLFLHKTIRVR
ncbi:hypothetical protein WH52_05380 [Tenacibaculum holothuriorum]|uniref:Major facilitator superfamily (MFS) profile domain-containing protein n=1 Tax=Tenacibaculum holothuriorum TaxID=1635173 RepID=A0A1Y2PCN0_9FLAO|nr:MFS transporter [Tenacibaculum holothuriorum]OSY88216.1 hypothetical protein WH52_05380 [Tenacibaculum holothuriorum]